MTGVRALVDRIGIVEPFRIRDFRLLWTGMFVSMAGDGFYYVAVAWQVYDLSDRPSSLAMVGIAWSLPQVLLVLLSGVLADRLDRRMLMIGGDVVRAVAIGTVGFLSIRGDLTIPNLVASSRCSGSGRHCSSRRSIRSCPTSSRRTCSCGRTRWTSSSGRSR